MSYLHDIFSHLATVDLQSCFWGSSIESKYLKINLICGPELPKSIKQAVATVIQGTQVCEKSITSVAMQLTVIHIYYFAIFCSIHQLVSL